MATPLPQPTLSQVVAYAVPHHPAPVDLDLSGNLGPALDPADFPPLRAEDLRSYPDARPLEAALAARLGLPAAQVVVTAGADDAIDRLCRAVLCPGREALLTEPGFLVTALRARLAGADVVALPWPAGPFPTALALDRPRERVALVVVTSPNNPTGTVASAADLQRLSAAFPQAVLLVDLAYTEYADTDLTAAALALPNAVVTRTLSKAWGLAGLRLGYAASTSPLLVDWLRTAGMPYAVAAPALTLAHHWLTTGEATVHRHVAWVRHARAALAATLTAAGADVLPSQANFVFCRHPREDWLRDALAGQGIAVRAFPGSSHGGLRFGCPPDDASLVRVQEAIQVALSPVARTGPDTPPVPGGWALCPSPAAVQAARAVGAVPVGLGTDPDPLLAAGAARVLPSIQHFAEDLR